MRWFEIDNPEDLTLELLEQKKRDYRLMFYGSPNNQAILAEIIIDIESCEDIVARNVLRDLIKKIKVNCGLDDYRKLIEAESKILTKGEKC